MLDAYDRAREKSKGHKVETSHGPVAEAEFRKWLSGFLPKRYGVTSGYIVSPGLKSTEKTPHFDVIIYDRLESPVLWIEDSPDASSQGRSLAIPVEYVRCVLEVKSTFTSSNVTKAIQHLNDLSRLMGGPDDSQEKYKMYLPSTFCCGLVFFELKKETEYSELALRKIISGIGLRNFFGGIILRGEGHSKQLTGDLSILRSGSKLIGIIGKGKASLLNAGYSQSIKVSDNLHFGASLTWEEPNFAKFAFDLIAMMQGTYEVGRMSSFYGFGVSDFEISGTEDQD